MTDEPGSGSATSTREAPDGVGRVGQSIPNWLRAVGPLLVLIGLLAVFVVSGPLAGVEGGEPLPDVSVTHVTLTDDHVALHIVNNGPGSVTISQVLVDEAYWSFSVAGGDRTIAPLESRTVHVPYHWQPGWDFEVAFVLSNGATIEHTVVAPATTPGITPATLWTLAVLGVFVGVIPVAIGMLWYPYLQSVTDGTLHLVLAFSGGILAFLAVDAGIEATELAEEVPGVYEGLALAFLGAVGTLLLVQSISAWRRQRMEGNQRVAGLEVAYLVALGIGLHNLAEGLAIGSSFALGRVSLGTFLVVGFMLHNVTEGPAVVAPLGNQRRPHIAHFLALGILAGAPVILGGWIGGFAFSATLGVLFLSIGIGAILQVLVELSSLIENEGGRVASAHNLLGFLLGLLVMYATDLLVAI